MSRQPKTKRKISSQQLHRAARTVRSELVPPWEPDLFPGWNDALALRQFAVKIMCQLARHDENGFVKFRAAAWLDSHAEKLLVPQQALEDPERLKAHSEIIEILERKGITGPMEPLEMEVVTEEDDG